MTECVSCAKFKGCDLSSPNVNECADYKEILTNDEWRRTCSTEEFAEFLCNVAVTDVLWDKIRQPYYTDGKQAVVEWLKEKHT